MAFTYNFATDAPISYVRLLIADTDSSQPLFVDDEINAAFTIQQMQLQSGMRYSGTAGTTLPATPVSYLRVAALLLDALAANKSKLAMTNLLDAKVDFQKASDALRAQAKQYRETDDDAGAFAIIEQVNTTWNFQDRFYRQIQRQTAQ